MVLSTTPAWIRTSADFEVPRSASVSPMNSGAATPDASSAHKNHKSVKQLWKEIKHAVAEHHRGVNAAYASYYGAGAGSSCPGRRPS